MTAYIYQGELTNTIHWGELFSEEVIEIDYDIIQDSEEVEGHGLHTIITEEIVLNKSVLYRFDSAGLLSYSVGVKEERGNEIIEKIKKYLQ